MLAIGYRIGSLKMRLGCGLVGKRVAHPTRQPEIGFNVNSKNPLFQAAYWLNWRWNTSVWYSSASRLPSCSAM